jgi:hypothetical protein
MKKFVVVSVALLAGSLTVFGQGKGTTKAAPAASDTVFFDKSFSDAGNAPSESQDYHLAPKFYKAGELAPEQPIALTTAKKLAVDLARSRPTQLRKDCINLIYTVDPIYDDGSITGALKGTIVIKWDIKRRVWAFNYLKYQLINIDQNACVFLYSTE